MALPPDDLEKLVHSVHSYIGRSIKIDESISRSRDIGAHDRHFATHTHFILTVETVMAAISGAQLIISSPNGRYGISLDSVTSYLGDETTLEIIEHFEQQTERRTTITAV